jgi:hypothetical protein
MALLTILMPLQFLLTRNELSRSVELSNVLGNATVFCCVQILVLLFLVAAIGVRPSSMRRRGNVTKRSAIFAYLFMVLATISLELFTLVNYAGWAQQSYMYSSDVTPVSFCCVLSPSQLVISVCLSHLFDCLPVSDHRSCTMQR